MEVKDGILKRNTVKEAKRDAKNNRAWDQVEKSQSICIHHRCHIAHRYITDIIHVSSNFKKPECFESWPNYSLIKAAKILRLIKEFQINCSFLPHFKTNWKFLTKWPHRISTEKNQHGFWLDYCTTTVLTFVTHDTQNGRNQKESCNITLFIDWNLNAVSDKTDHNQLLREKFEVHYQILGLFILTG